MPLAADERERRLIPEMILDLALLDARAVQLGRERVGDTRDARVKKCGLLFLIFENFSF